MNELKSLLAASIIGLCVGGAFAFVLLYGLTACGGA